MIISAIAAMDRVGLIGNGSRMPWHLPRDLKRFREYTLGKPLIMGRRTLDSLRSPLPGRLNIVLTRSRSLDVDGVCVARSIEEALAIAQDQLHAVGGEETMIIGGDVVFQETVDRWDRLLLTVVEGQFQGDIYFPVDKVKRCRWKLLNRDFCNQDMKNAYSHSFFNLERISIDHANGADFDLSAWLSAGQTVPSNELPVSHG